MSDESDLLAFARSQASAVAEHNVEITAATLTVPSVRTFRYLADAKAFCDAINARRGAKP